MSVKILEEIKKAEEKAGLVLEEAHAEKQRLILQSKQNAVKLMSESELQYQAERDNTLAKRRDSVKKIVDDTVRKGAAEQGKLEEKTKKNLQDSVTFVLKTFEDVCRG